MNTRNLATGLLGTLLLMASGQAAANTTQQSLFPQNSYGAANLPSIGQTDSTVLTQFGEPAQRLRGANGVDMWDYGNFRVVFRNDTVTFAAMWRQVK